MWADRRSQTRPQKGKTLIGFCIIFHFWIINDFAWAANEQASWRRTIRSRPWQWNAIFWRNIFFFRTCKHSPSAANNATPALAIIKASNYTFCQSSSSTRLPFIIQIFLFASRATRAFTYVPRRDWYSNSNQTKMFSTRFRVCLDFLCFIRVFFMIIKNDLEATAKKTKIFSFSVWMIVIWSLLEFDKHVF